MSAPAPVLEMRGIRKSFPGVTALDGVDLDVLTGEVHALLGENGAGKSTLMKILSGAVPADAGEIRLGGRPVRLTGPRQAQQLGIRTIYQELNLVPQLGAAENILLGQEPRRVPGIIHRRQLRERGAALMADVGLELDPETPVAELGVAQQQLIEVARALSGNARVLVMDEPTSALTDSETSRLFSLIRRLTARGVAVVYISHRLEEVTEVGDRVTVLRDGRRVATRPGAALTPAEMIRLMVDREVGAQFPRRRPSPGEELLRVEHLRRGAALQDVSFALRRGEIVGVAGLLGAGRTELARALIGAEPAEGGRILLAGAELAPRSPAQARRAGLGLLPEDRKTQGLVLDLSVRHNLALASGPRLSRAGIVDGAAEAALARRSVEELRIRTPSLERQVVYLSGGNQQKVMLGRWLAAQVDVLLMDEPTRGVDVAARVEIYALMNRLTEQGKGILMISSDLPEVLGMSDRILVLHGGRSVAMLDAREASQRQVLAAALGQAS